MNKFFGFFRDKLVEVKQENTQEIQKIVTALEGEPYSQEQMLVNMQQIKTNFLQWNIMIANQASTGLYFAQMHNKSCALKKARNMKQNQGKMTKNNIVLGQMQRTVKELKGIEALNKEWTNSMSKKVQKLASIVRKEKELRKQQSHKGQQCQREGVQQKSEDVIE